MIILYYKNGFTIHLVRKVFKENAVINYDGKIINGDSIYFENEKSYVLASFNIKINDTINNSIIMVIMVKFQRKRFCNNYKCAGSEYN